MDLSFSSIARVRAQARASLKNPSRPFTPRTTRMYFFKLDLALLQSKL